MLAKLRLTAVLLSFALLASACGNSGDSGSNAEPEQTTTTAPPPQEGDADTENPAAADQDDNDDGDDAGSSDEPDPPAEDDPPTDVFIPLEDVPGVTDEEIGVAVISTKSNNLLGTCIFDCYVTGIEAYFDMVNSEGGLYGRQLVIEERLDDELFNNQAKALEVVANEDSLAAFVAPLQATGYADLDKAGVPTFNWGIHASIQNGLRANFGHIGPGCPDCTNRFIPYLAQQAGATRVAALGYGISENSKVCANTYAASIDSYAADIGAETVYINDDMAFGLPNGVGPEVTEMIEAGVDFIASCLDLNAMKTIAQELERQGARDQIVMHHPNSYDQQFVADAGDLFDGDFAVPSFAPFESTGIPAIEAFNRWVDANGGPASVLTMVGWINADLFVEGLKATGPEFSRESLIATINSEFVDYSAGGLTNAVDWSRQHVVPTNEDRMSTGPVLECVSAVRMQGDAFELLGEPDAPFLCWDNSTTDWSEPVATSFS